MFWREIDIWLFQVILTSWQIGSADKDKCGFGHDTVKATQRLVFQPKRQCCHLILFLVDISVFLIASSSFQRIVER